MALRRQRGVIVTNILRVVLGVVVGPMAVPDNKHEQLRGMSSHLDRRLHDLIKPHHKF